MDFRVRRGWALVVPFALGVLPACSSGTDASGEDAATEPTPFVTLPAPAGDGAADAVGDEPGDRDDTVNGSELDTATPANDPPSDVADPLPVTTPPAGSPATTSATPAVDESDAPAEVVFDEPVFEVEPLQPLDLTVATFPVDDAGIGGSPDAPAAELTGWAGFDASMQGQLMRFGNTAASVAVSIGGDVVHAAAFGQRSGDPGDPAGPEDRFRIASISKTITAITLLQLVEDGVVGLDEPVGGVVAFHLGIGAPAAGVDRITVRQLLNHTSGFAKYEGVFFRAQSTDCVHAATIGLSRSLSGSPGGGYRYSNMNYCVAGLLVEALTGRPYEAVAYERVLTPLGLSGLRLAPTVDPGPDEILHPTTPGRNYMETLGASGAWIATPTDLVTIMNSLDPTTPGWKPLTDETLLAMLDPVGGTIGDRGYGLGVISYGPGRYGHTGTIESTHAMVMNRGDGVIWAVTVSGPYPDDTPRLESIVNQAFEAGGFVAG